MLFAHSQINAIRKTIWVWEIKTLKCLFKTTSSVETNIALVLTQYKNVLFKVCKKINKINHCMFEKYLLWIKKFTIFGLFMTLDIQKLEFWLLVNFGTHGKSVTRVLWKSFETRISENKYTKTKPTADPDLYLSQTHSDACVISLCYVSLFVLSFQKSGSIHSLTSIVHV